MSKALDELFKPGTRVKVLSINPEWDNYRKELVQVEGTEGVVKTFSKGYGGQVLLEPYGWWIPISSLEVLDSNDTPAEETTKSLLEYAELQNRFQQQIQTTLEEAELAKKLLDQARTKISKLESTLSNSQLDCSDLREKVIALQDENIALLKFKLLTLKVGNVGN